MLFIRSGYTPLTLVRSRRGPVLNPYTPNAGAEPQVLIGRDDQLASFDLLLKRITRGMTEQSMIISGLRGVGKTVLLGRFRRVALESDWVVVELEVSKHDDDQFHREIAARLLAACEPKTLRYRLLHVPARITRGGRRRRLWFPKTWPWVQDIVAVFARIIAIPRAA